MTDDEITILRAGDKCRYAAAYASACFQMVTASIAMHKEACRLRASARQSLHDLRENIDAKEREERERMLEP